jgi:hypothetical protein
MCQIALYFRCRGAGCGDVLLAEMYRVIGVDVLAETYSTAQDES